MKSLLIAILFLHTSFAYAGSWRNYTDLNAPVYQGSFASGSVATGNDFKVVTMNIHWSETLNELIKIIKTHKDFKIADAFLLQEVVGEPGSETNHAAHELAEALGFNYAYVPAFIHKKNEKDFGVAILTPHPITDVRKIILPYTHFLDKTQRVAVGATIHTPAGSVRTYSIHAETLQLTVWRHCQVASIFEDADLYPGQPLILGGDFNSAPIWQRWFLFRFVEKRGWQISTKQVRGATFRGAGGLARFRLDHILSKNIRVKKAGKVRAPNISNHDFLWADFSI